MLVSLNLKDEETVALVAEVAKRLGMTKTGVVRELARQRLAQLDASEQSDIELRVADDLRWLEANIWSHAGGGPLLGKKEIEDITGMTEMHRQ